MIFTAPCSSGLNIRNPYLHGSTTSVLKGSRPQDVLPSSGYTTCPPLNHPLERLKNIISPKVAHSLIPSHRKLFITLACVILVFYVAKNQNQSRSNSHNTIIFFVPTRPINLSTSHLATTCITNSSGVRGRKDALSLTYPTVTTNW